MSKNELCDNNMNEIDEIGSLRIKEIENTSNIKNDENDVDKYNYPFSTSNKNDESDLIQYSLLKELEDKWSYIEKNKKKTRNVTDLSDSKSFNTNYTNNKMISLQNCKNVIEESRRKYLLRKEKEKLNEDFDSYVKEKSKQLRQLTRNYTTNNGKTNEKVNNTKVIKSFLQPEEEKSKENKIHKSIVIEKEIKKAKMNNKGKDSKIYNKIKNVFGIITNDKTISIDYSSNTNAINKNDLSLNDLDKNFNRVLEQLSPNMKKRSILTCNRLSPKEKYSNLRMVNKIKQNKSLINALVLNSQNKKTAFHSYISQSKKYKSPISSHSYTPNICEKNNFSTAEYKLFNINSPTVEKIIKC